MKESIILLHGALGSSAQFESLSNILSEHLNVFSFDFEGHGQTQSTQNFSIELFTDNLFDFILKNKIDHFHLFGYSMGGYVGLNFAKNYHTKVEKLITLGTKFDWTKEFAQNEVKLLNPDKIEEKVPKFAQDLEKIHTSNNWKMVVQHTAKMMSDLGDGKSLNESDFEKIENEVLILLGDKDHMVSLEESKTIADLLPHGTFQILNDTPHGIEKVDMVKLSTVIINFIN